MKTDHSLQCCWSRTCLTQVFSDVHALSVGESSHHRCPCRRGNRGVDGIDVEAQVDRFLHSAQKQHVLLWSGASDRSRVHIYIFLNSFSVCWDNADKKSSDVYLNNYIFTIFSYHTFGFATVTRRSPEGRVRTFSDPGLKYSLVFFCLWEHVS